MDSVRVLIRIEFGRVWVSQQLVLESAVDLRKKGLSDQILRVFC